jgi:hypothetical protein
MQMLGMQFGYEEIEYAIYIERNEYAYLFWTIKYITSSKSNLQRVIHMIRFGYEEIQYAIYIFSLL